ncbi:MAG: rhomboid family intramembrane serine protease [Bacilli bacterium]
MDEVTQKNELVMKLLHYFITEKNYNPIILQGAENEIWLENMDNDYKIVRIVSNHIHNKEQLSFDVFKTKRVVKKIKKKTFSFNMNVLSIFTDIGDNVELLPVKNNTLINVNEEKDLMNYECIKEYFPDILKKLVKCDDDMQLYIKLTSDINKKSQENNKEVEEVFRKKKPTITRILVTINILIYLSLLLSGTNFYNRTLINFGMYAPYIRSGEIYRLITCAFLHANIFHLLFNCYALYIIGSQIESFMGKAKYLFIYLFSAVTGALMSMIFSGNSLSIGASGAIFGLLGSLLYFGYHYRVYLGSVIKSQIIPLIIVNLAIGFMNMGIDNYAHIGGLIGGVLATSAVGVKYKSSKSQIINGIVMTIIYVVFLIFMAFYYTAK